MRDNGDKTKRTASKPSRPWEMGVTGSLGLGGVLTGTCLWVNADHIVPALTGSLGSLGYCAPALPGILMLVGTALLGVALIRMQDR